MAQPGDSCYDLAKTCHVPLPEFLVLHGQTGYCASVVTGQIVCCGDGKLPFVAPKPNADGSCKTYTVVPGDWCYLIAAANDILQVDLEKWNQKTPGWKGCAGVKVGDKLCVTPGTFPVSA